jgi:hypothetical protein
MNLMKRSPKLVALSAGVLLVYPANPRNAVHAAGNYLHAGGRHTAQ